MALLTWDGAGKRLYETGVDQGVLYIPDANGAYTNGVAWNGLVGVTESPTGAEANAQYADNTKYLNLYSLEQYEATLEAFTYPDEWNQFDGNGTGAGYPGVTIGQQVRKSFGLSYRTKLGNDLLGDDYAYKLHLVYGLKASPSEKAFTTINDSPSPITFSWSMQSTPAATTGRAATSLLTIDSSKALSANLTALNNILYGNSGNPQLPTPDVVITTMTATTVTPITAITTIPVSTTGGAVTIVAQTGVQYRRRDTGAIVAAGAPSFTITGTAPQYVIIDAEPIAATGSLLYYFGPYVQTSFVMAKTV
jgi:hypothetical protein